MKKHTFILLLLSIIYSSCGREKAENEFVFFINSYKVDCTGVAPMKCFQVYKGDEFKDDSWESFYSQIDGFEYQAGYIYKLRVMEEKLDPSEVPADASSIKYTLIEVLDKKIDSKLRINDIWLLSKISGERIELSNKIGSTPVIEFHVAESRFIGNDGCNDFNGSIEKLSYSEIKLGNAMSTRKMCPDMSVTDSFNKMLAQVKSYSIESGYLVLYNSGKEEILAFKKID